MPRGQTGAGIQKYPTYRLSRAHPALTLSWVSLTQRGQKIACIAKFASEFEFAQTSFPALDLAVLASTSQNTVHKVKRPKTAIIFTLTQEVGLGGRRLKHNIKKYLIPLNAHAKYISEHTPRSFSVTDQQHIIQIQKY